MRYKYKTTDLYPTPRNPKVLFAGTARFLEVKFHIVMKIVLNIDDESEDSQAWDMASKAYLIETITLN